MVLIAGIFTQLSSCRKPEEVSLNTPIVTVYLTEKPSYGQEIINLNSFSYYNSNTQIISDENLEHVTLNSHSARLTVENTSFFEYDKIKKVVYTIKGIDYNDKKRIIQLEVVLLKRKNLNSAVQKRLNNGETPRTIINSDASLKDSLVGKQYRGGTIYHLSTRTGFIISPVDMESSRWGCNGTNFTKMHSFSGESNTKYMTLHCSADENAGGKTRGLTIDGINGWHLPSIDELRILNYSKDKIDLNNFSSLPYWSSSANPDNDSTAFGAFLLDTFIRKTYPCQGDSLLIRAKKEFTF